MADRGAREAATAVAGPTIGVAIAGGVDAVVSLAEQAERRGVHSVWVAEIREDSIVQASLVAARTSRVRIGTNITLAFPRSPTVTAMQAWDLDGVTGGRFVLGLGSQVRRVVEERYGAAFSRPAERMEDYVRAMRTVWAMERGEVVPYEGEFHRVLRPGLNGPGTAVRQDPPTYVAAVGPRMVAGATRVADGILGHPFTSAAYLADVLVPRIEQGLDAAGRDRSDFTLAQGVIASVSDDRDQARREAARQIAFYGSTPNYRGVLEAAGDGELGGRLHEVFRASGGAPEAMEAAVADDVVDRYAVAGRLDEVADRVLALARHVDHVILSTPWYHVDAASLRDNLDGLVELADHLAADVEPARS